ncbi:N-acetylmuramoyl-L-alanine amidase [Pediococcus damnosus]|uniref:N-acetylmuramoyl-L-alanine amidase n=1 Tax=Pediococcus damnosus TaxID=51663 RepID=A0ABN4NA79_9LACO|nr:glycoside hydrolase family 73 protein [Pediococcus damnosus]AMV61168.1 N-acetylmuramoyl-L-alanine amidase [Pediococcus damnosus]AMV66333.1 N-acetylmuramoyl-L-alanine amidase [Pediococcus damnosus]AMV68633.1 N-acetylmuramoyl-L-alanine amidase [Pediococcus damnosus]KJU75092.1 N-acetylmuramidase [Pediococcus damnosus LMG 28219]KRN52255.1 N-acetylmuramidase [Pediococcus damnosus]
MAKRKRKKTNFLFKRGKLQLSGVISLILIFGLVVVLAVQLVPRISFTNNQQSTNLSTKSHQQFIQTIAPYAKEMHQSYGVLPSITIAQAILESDWGTSQLSERYNNYFGMKGTIYQTTKEMKTEEFVNGKWITVTARFRVYNSWKDSVKDHTMLFVNGTNWNRNQYKNVLTAKNYKTAAQALYTAGYATDPGYPNKLIEIIQSYQLEKYDQ